MNRQQKEAVVNDVKEMLTGSQAAFLVGYKGLDVASMQSLRKDLREVGGKLKVTKARLMKIAAQGIEGIDGFQESFKDQVGLVLATQEVPSVAKALSKFAQDNEALRIVSGFFESKVISKQEVDYLASIPSKEILLARLMGTIQAPVTNLARLLNMMIIRLLIVLKQVSEKEAK